MIARTTRRPKVATVRCAIYCRQSVSDDREEFSSLDAQREAAEAFVVSQQGRGWRASATRYDDASQSGGTADRPALTRLLADVEDGLIDCVVVYKIDRLSRSIADFVNMMDLFDKHGVAFAAVTQQFDTTTSVGRLTLNLLTCFAQFEREQISERTRDKVHAARRRGRWTGGPPPLGYDVAHEGGSIVVNDEEAKRVRAIFALYGEVGTMTGTVRAMNQRGWLTKSWTTRKDRHRPGTRWTKQTLRTVLTNPVYLGRTRLGDEVHDGEHDGIITQATWDRTQALLAEGANNPAGTSVGRRGTALLSGLLRCGPCDATMGHTHTRRRGKAYRYYVCRKTRTEGWAACASPSVAAHDIETLVVDQIRAIGRDRALQDAVLAAVREQGAEVEPADLRRALTLFDPVWDALHADEKKRVIRLLVQRVTYDGAAGTAAVTLRATGIRTLAEEVAP